MVNRTRSPAGPPAALWSGLCQLIANRKPTVLLAEDDPNVSLMISLLLKAQDFDVKVADSGLQALHLAQRWKPDIVVLDINLPEMSGLDICRALKSNPRTCAISIVFCSGESHLAAEALSVGGAAFLEKPGGVLRLTACLHEILNGNRRFNF